LPHYTPATDSSHVANYDPALRLLETSYFELSLESGFKWAHPEQAREIFGGELPQTFLQFTSGFEHIEPRLSIARLKALLPGAQGQWTAQYHHNSSVEYYEIIAERASDSSQGDDSFIGIIRNVTRAYLYCPQAVQISFKLKDYERVERFYGSLVQTHIEYELLRRLIAFLPQAASIARGAETLLCLLPDVTKIDAESLSQALTAFPVATPEGPVSVELDVSVHRLAVDKTKTIEPVKSASGIAPVPIITEADILGLLNQRSLSLALQPVCMADTGALHHYEALMRIDDPLKGPQSAWRHILAAEKLGLVHLLDQRALERAALLMIRYPDIHLALNVSAGTIGDMQKQMDYLNHLDAYPALHSRLSFEMTETMALGHLDMAAQFAERLRTRGCYLSIDDFGAGHTSFETLMVTEARQIKLDGSLIEGVCRSADKQNFVRLMVDFAHTFDVKLVAERVETKQEQRLLSALGVDYLQGYYLGKPISEHAFTGRMDMNAKI